MGLREKLTEKIRKKELEIQELEMKMREGKAYIQALRDTIKALPREYGTSGATERTLRVGSAVFKACEYIKKVGEPLHISTILEGIGKENTKKERISLAGSLAWYVRKNEIFTRPAPNTFGLIEFDTITHVSDEPPDDFGSLPNKDDEEDVPF